MNQFEDEDLDIEKSISSLKLPQTKQDYQEFRKMARHDLNMRSKMTDHLGQSTQQQYENQNDVEPDVSSLI